VLLISRSWIKTNFGKKVSSTSGHFKNSVKSDQRSKKIKVSKNGANGLQADWSNYNNFNWLTK
jgi:hypothetical protein